MTRRTCGSAHNERLHLSRATRERMNVVGAPRGRAAIRRPLALAYALLASLGWGCSGPDEPSIGPERMDSAGLALVLNAPADRLVGTVSSGLVRSRSTSARTSSSERLKPTRPRRARAA
jgi:hypothetical protein